MRPMIALHADTLRTLATAATQAAAMLQGMAQQATSVGNSAAGTLLEIQADEIQAAALQVFEALPDPLAGTTGPDELIERIPERVRLIEDEDEEGAHQ